MDGARTGLALGLGWLVLVYAAPASGVPRKVFVTSVAGSGDFSTWADTNLDGLDGGDEICQASAAAAGLANAGTFRAWLSTAATDAFCHLFGETGQAFDCNNTNPDWHAMGPWERTDGLAFAGDLAELTSGDPLVYRPLLLNENGVHVADGALIWTGTNQFGTVQTDHCSGWDTETGDGAYGEPDVVGNNWTSSSTTSCAESHRLVCFEPGVGEPALLRGKVGATVFMTSTEGTGDLSTWDETDLDGIPGADQICRVRAAAAHLPSPSSYFALISSAAVDAVDRITYPGPFIRVDGINLAVTKAELFSPTTDLVTGLNVTELEEYLGSDSDDAWTGSLADGTADTGVCSNWSSSSANGTFGDSFKIDEQWLSVFLSVCSSSKGLYCFTNQETLFWDGFERGNTSRWSNGTV